MLNIRKVGVALALGLMLCLTLMTSGASAQNVDHSSIRSATITAVATGALHEAQLVIPQQVKSQQGVQAQAGWCGWWGCRRWWRPWWWGCGGFWHPWRGW